MKPVLTLIFLSNKILINERAVGNSRALARWMIAVLSLTHVTIAAAYVGPGAGLTAIGTFIALVSTVMLGIIGFLWYPVKRLLKRNKRRTVVDNPQSRKEHDA